MRKTQCPLCDVNLNSSSDMMIHLKYRHFLPTTEVKTEIKTEPGTPVPRIKLPGRRCDNCKKIMKKNGEGYYECTSCSRTSLDLSDQHMELETEDFELTLNNENPDFSGYDFRQNDPGNNDIFVKTEAIQNSSEDQITNIVCSDDFNSLISGNSVKTEQGEPLPFPGKPGNSADIKGVAKKSMKSHTQLPRIEQARSLFVSPTPPAQEEPEVLKISYFRCPMCNNPYREKSEVELHIIGTHNMTIDMLKTMVTCGAIKIIEETFQ